MTRFLLVRHATADSPRPDSGLTSRGRAEAEALAARLGEQSIDAIWSSDYERALETARAILSRHGHLPLHRSPALREVEIPAGLTPESDPSGYRLWEREALARLSAGLREWVQGASGTDLSPNPSPMRGGECSPFPRGEGGQGVRSSPARGGELAPFPCREGGEGLGRIRGVPRDTTVLVISHAGPLRVLICLLLGLPPEQHWSFRLDRAGLTVVERCHDLGTLTLLNDRCHLNGVI